MSIAVADNFQYKGSKPLDARIKYNTVADMKAVSESDLYDGCLAYVTATKKNYQFDSSNTTDPTTGKWRELQTGGGGGSYTAGDGITIDNNEISVDEMPNEDMDDVITPIPTHGGGGSGGGHTIEDNGTEMTQRDTLNFVDFDLEDDTQNEKTVVQTHELTPSEFNEIFSTLPTMLDRSNSSNEANNLSLSEKVIGTFVDGKPLYQRTISCGAMPNNTTKTVAHNIASIESIVSMTGFAQDEDVVGNDGCIPLPFTMSGNSTAYQIYIKATYTDIILKCDSDMSEFSKSFVTLQYTKTTDTAVASGEKIVGQWIDGKPLYQKTYSLTNVSATKSLSTLLSVASMNVKDIKGYCSFNNVNAELSVNTILGSDDYQFFVYNDNGILKYTAYYYGNTIKEVVLTLQYTKTTD